MIDSENTPLTQDAQPMTMTSPLLDTPIDAQHTDNDDAQSETSTIRYSWCDHEPFETFQHKIAKLCANRLKCDPSSIKVDHMDGGSYNRVVAVTIDIKPKRFTFPWLKSQYLGCIGKTQRPESKRYIVRIPRSKDDEIEEDVTKLIFANLHVPLPTPEVVAYDLTKENIINQPYMILERLPGENLSDLWNSLNMKQKHCVAKQVAKLASSIATVEGPLGFPSLGDLTKPSKDIIQARKFQISLDYNPEEMTTSKKESCLDHLLEQIERLREEDRDEVDGWQCWEQYWNGFEAITKALEARHFLNGSCVLAHGDLKDYNLLATIISDTEVKISGVIDWDFAMFAPKYMAYRAPFWLWTPEDTESQDKDDEAIANLIPTTDEARQLKQTFLDNVSEEYKKYAFAPESLIARKIFPFIQEGLIRSWTIPDAENLIREWSELHHDDGVKPVVDEFAQDNTGFNIDNRSEVEEAEEDGEPEDCN